MAGLLAARSLSDFFDTVTVVERDPLLDTPTARRGVPQGRHVHGLLASGAQVLEQLFPGILDELMLNGAHYFDGADLSRLHHSLGGHPLVNTGSARSFNIYQVTRPFLEEHVRGRLCNIPNVTLLHEHDIVASTWTSESPGHSRITGARVSDCRTGEDYALAADLVVDATGRGGRTPFWLDSLGYGRPDEDHVTVNMTYASQALRMHRKHCTKSPFSSGTYPAGRAVWACCTARTTPGLSP